MLSLVTGLFFLLLLLNQRRSPPLRLQVSHCRTFRSTCDVPSKAVFCSESIECFLGVASKFFLITVDTILVAPIITGMILHFRFHILCISLHKLCILAFCIIIIIIIIIIVRVIKSRIMRWAGHVARMGEGRGVYRILV